MKPTTIAETLAKVVGASKKMSPLNAIGSLFKAPTIEYVVDEVTRTHHADVYEMKTDERPENTIAIMRLFLVSSGKFLAIFAEDQFSRNIEQTRRIGIDKRLL